MCCSKVQIAECHQWKFPILNQCNVWLQGNKVVFKVQSDQSQQLQENQTSIQIQQERFGWFYHFGVEQDFDLITLCLNMRIGIFLSVRHSKSQVHFWSWEVGKSKNKSRGIINEALHIGFFRRAPPQLWCDVLEIKSCCLKSFTDILPGGTINYLRFTVSDSFTIKHRRDSWINECSSAQGFLSLLVATLVKDKQLSCNYSQLASPNWHPFNLVEVITFNGNTCMYGTHYAEFEIWLY